MIETAEPPNAEIAATGPRTGSAEWWNARYRSGDIPWDTGIVPPEVVDLIEGGTARTGWALDLGCGSGLSTRYLASWGFRVVGLDLALSALVRAARAAQAEALPAYFCLADVTDLGFLDLRASFALDVGCFHAVAPESRAAYVASLAARLLPGAFYLLYAFTPSWEDESGPHGINPADIGRFAPEFVLRWGQHGQDQDRPSAWYLLQRC